MSTYFSILTAIGEAKLANAIALGGTLKLTKMGVGDGNGVVPVPDRLQKALIKENRRELISQLSRDPDNASQVIIEQAIPGDVGGWWVREVGIYDEAGDLCAVANCPPSYKPLLTDGAGRDQVLRVVLLVTSTANVELKIDPSVVLATRKYADEAILAYAAPKDHIHPTLAPLASPQLTGKPNAPTANEGANDGQIANTAFVAKAIDKAVMNVIPYLSAIPSQKIADAALIKGIGLMEWVEVTGAGAFIGYRSLRCGALEFGTTTAPRGYEADLVGGLGSKTTQASIWAWAQEQGHSVAAASWSAKVFKFADVDGNTFRFPDMRDIFPRFMGTDADTLAARALGSLQGDQNKAHTHGYGQPNTTGAGSNTSGIGTSNNVTSTASSGGAEARPINTAFAPRIHL